jgi:hypothetical protein
MNETCDRCGPAVRAAYRVDRSGELYLCRHCTNLLRPALSAQGWSIRGHSRIGRGIRNLTARAIDAPRPSGARQIKFP